jgi:hypothetical protein
MLTSRDRQARMGPFALVPHAPRLVVGDLVLAAVWEAGLKSWSALLEFVWTRSIFRVGVVVVAVVFLAWRVRGIGSQTADLGDKSTTRCSEQQMDDSRFAFERGGNGGAPTVRDDKSG